MLLNHLLTAAYLRSIAEGNSPIGIQGASNLLRQLNIINCHTAYTTATLACVNHFARGLQDGQYIAFNELGPPQWLSLLQGVRIIVEMFGIERVFAELLVKLPLESASKATVPAILIFKRPRPD